MRHFRQKPSWRIDGKTLKTGTAIKANLSRQNEMFSGLLSNRTVDILSLRWARHRAENEVIAENVFLSLAIVSEGLAPTGDSAYNARPWYAARPRRRAESTAQRSKKSCAGERREETSVLGARIRDLIQEKKFSRGGRSLALDVAILHQVFGIAVECEMLAKNPVRLEGRPGDSAEHGAQPFSGDQLTKLRQAANEDLLAYLLLRWTGLRGSDAVRLTWDEIDWEAREINRLTQKRKKRVLLPVPKELFFALETEREKRKPQPADRILLNPG